MDSQTNDSWLIRDTALFTENEKLIGRKISCAKVNLFWCVKEKFEYQKYVRQVLFWTAEIYHFILVFAVFIARTLMRLTVVQSDVYLTTIIVQHIIRTHLLWLFGKLVQARKTRERSLCVNHTASISTARKKFLQVALRNVKSSWSKEEKKWRISFLGNCGRESKRCLQDGGRLAEIRV